MNYYIDKKSAYLQQYRDEKERLKREMASLSSQTEGSMKVSEDVMNQNIRAAKESKQNRLDELSDSLKSSLKQISERYTDKLNEIENTYKNKKSQAEFDYRVDINNKITSMEKQLNEFNSNAVGSVITMAPYLQKPSSVYVAPVLDKAPELDQIKDQARHRTYLPQVLTGIQKVNNGTKTCVLPAYAEWQTMDDATTATTGNFMVMYNRNTCLKQAMNMVDGMIFRMLMAFPVGSLHVSVIDPKSLILEGITQRMQGCEELYNKKVYKESGEIAQHLKILEAKIEPIKQEFNRATEISLVQHNRNRIQQGYELVILYDPFSERPGYGDRLKNIMASGISAGIYVMIIQSDLMRPEVLQEFDFSSFSTIIKAEQKNFVLLKNQIRWDTKAQDFNSKESEIADYLPTYLDQSELIDPLDITLRAGLVSQFFNDMKKEWKNVTESLTTLTWDSWTKSYNEADIECWTNGIKVPIGINDDTKKEEYFRLENNEKYIHSFVIGKTRSGKSKFLCTTISSIAMKYSPLAVQMYLFDFKDGMAFRCYLGQETRVTKGGVVFRHYDEPVPHMRWLVTTQADKDMFLTVLKDLEKEQQRRKDLFSSYNFSNMEAYNKQMLKEGKKCLPRILLFVDECQDIYVMKDASSQSKKQREINQLFTNFARKYGAFGIHLILSSQMIPSDMNWISQLSNNYILNAGSAPFSQLLNNSNASRGSDEIQKRIGSMPDATGIYSTIEDAYVNMYAYHSPEHAGEYIRQRAERLLGANIQQFVTKKWTGELDVPYCKVPSSVSMEFGTNQIGDSTIGANIHTRDAGNVLLYGALGGERAQKLTMRTVLTSLRKQIATNTFSDPNRQPAVYIVNAWDQADDPVQDSNLILANLAKHDYIRLVQPEEAGALLLQLKQQMDDRMNRPVLLYFIGTKNIHLLRSDSKIRVPKTSTSADTEEVLPRWKQRVMMAENGNQPVKEEAYEMVKVTDLFEQILEGGPAVGIHTIMQVGSREDLEKLGFSPKDFRYFIFQQASNFTMWSDGTKMDLDADLEQLPVDEAAARTLFYDAENPDKEQIIIPFMLDDLVEEASKGRDVGAFIRNHTKTIS